MVGGEGFGSGRHRVVGDEWDTVIGDRVVGDFLSLDGGGDGENGLLGAPVASRGAGSATVLLSVVDLGRFGDGEADPAGCPRRGQGGAGGLFGGNPGLDAGLRTGQSGGDRGDPGLDPGCPG